MKPIVQKKHEKKHKSKNNLPLVHPVQQQVSHIQNHKKKKKKSFCTNCGKFGHGYKSCRQPIISIGIILYRFFGSKQRNEFLHIRRKDTIGYVDFVRGKYRLGEVSYILKLLNMMTNDEKNKIQTASFTDLWRDIWCISDNNLHVNKHKYEFDKSCRRLTILRQGYTLKHNKQFVKLSLLLDMSPNIYETPEWGFPKGRRSYGENDLQCAMREFTEETGIKSTEHTILPGRPIVTVFTGQNNRKYKHIFYVSKFTGDEKKIHIDQDNILQKSEIGAISWFTISQAKKMFRAYNQSKLRNLHIASKIISYNSN